MNIEQLAYLKCPDKIRAALINTTGKAPSLEVIRRKLDHDNATKRTYWNVGEPTERDALGYVPQRKKVKPEPKHGRTIITPEERAKIAAIAAKIPDRRVKRPTPGSGQYGRALIDYVCQELCIPQSTFFGQRRRGIVAAAASLITRVLRQIDKKRYSYPQIAKLFGRGDHSTVLYAYENWDIYKHQFPQAASLYDSLIEGLHAAKD